MALDGVRVGGIFVELELDQSKFNSALDGVESSLKNIGNNLSSIGKDLTLKVTTPITALGGAITKLGLDFEQGFAKVSTMFDETKVNTSALKDGLYDLSDAVNINTKDLNEGLYQALSAGVPISQDAGDALAFMEKSSKLAKGGFTDLTTAVDTNTTVMNAYGLGLESVDRIQNALINTQNQGKTTVDELGRSLSNVVPTAANLGISIEQVGSAFAAITAQGVPTAQASTQIRQAFVELSKSGTEADKAFKALAGQSFKQFIASGGTVSQAMALMKDGASGMGLEINDLFGSVEAANAALILASDQGSKKFNDTMKVMEENTGAVDEAFKKVTDTVGERWSSAFNQLKNAGAGFFDVIAPAIEKISEVIEIVTEKIKSFDDGTKKIIVTIAALAAAAGPVTFVLGEIIAAIGAIGVPAAAAIAAMGGLTAAMVSIYGTNQEFKRAIDEIISLLSQLAGRLYETGQNIMQGLIGGINSMIGPLSSILISIANTIISILRSILGIASPSKVAEQIGSQVGEGLSIGLDDSQAGVRESTQALAKSIEEELKINTERVNELGKAIEDALKEKYSQAYEAFKENSDRTIDQIQEEYNFKKDILEKETEARIKSLEEQQRAIEDGTDKAISSYEKEYENKLKYLDKEAYDKIQSIKKQIDAIDQKTEAERKALEEQKYLQELAEKQRAVYSAKSIEERVKAEQRLNDFIADYNRKKLLEQRDQQKETLKEEIDAIKSGVDEKKKEYKSELDTKIQNIKEAKDKVLDGLKEEKEQVKDNTKNLLEEYKKDLDAKTETEKGKLEAAKKFYDAKLDNKNIKIEAQTVLTTGDTDQITKLLETYNKKWQDAGQSYAEAMAEGLNSGKQSIKDAVSQTLSLQEIIPQQEAELESLKATLDSLATAGSGAGGAISGGLGEIKEIVPEVTEQMDGLKESVEKAVEPIKQVGETITNIQANVTAFSDRIKTAGENIISLKEGVSGVSEIFDKFQGYIEPIVSDLIPRFNSIIQSLTQESLPVLSQIFDYLSGTALPYISEKFNELINNILPKLLDLFQQYAKILAERFTVVIQYLTEEILPSFLEGFSTWLPVLTDIFGSIIELAETIFSALVDIISYGFEQSQKIFEIVWPYLKDFISDIWEAMKGIISGALKQIQGILNVVMGLIKGDWERVWKGIKQIVEGYFTGMKAIIEGAINIIYDLVSSWLGIMLKLWESGWNDLYYVALGIWDWIKDAVKQGADFIDREIGFFLSGINELWKTDWNNMYSWVSQVWKNITSAITGAIEGISGTIGDFMGWIDGAINKIIDFNNTDFTDKNLTVTTRPGEDFNIQKFAKGVKNFRGGPALVGEQGPELVNLPPGSSVMNNKDTGNLLSLLTSLSQKPQIIVKELHVRDEIDIQLIARELLILQNQQNRGIGVNV